MSSGKSFDISGAVKRKFNKELKDERGKKIKATKAEQKRIIHNCLENLLYLSNREASYPRDLNQMYEGEYEVLDWRPPLYVEREVHPGGEVKWIYHKRENDQGNMVDLINRGLVAMIDCTVTEVDRNGKDNGRTIKIKVKSYSGIPVRRIDIENGPMGRPTS